MAKVGRPDTEFDLIEVKRLAEHGLNQQEIAYILGICPDTISRQKKKDPELSKAISEGKATDKKSLIKKMRDLVLKGNNKYNATKYLLSALHGLSETSKIDVTSDGKPLTDINITVKGSKSKLLNK